MVPLIFHALVRQQMLKHVTGASTLQEITVLQMLRVSC